AQLVTGSATTTSLELTWVDASNDETGFELERGAAASGPFAKIASSVANATSYGDVGLMPGTAYFYRVRAINAAGASAYSNVASGTTTAQPAPAAPSSLVATAL